MDTSKNLEFVQRIANFLADAEQMGRIDSFNTMPGRDIPPFERWSFKESHYEQYLVDLLCVNQGMAQAVKRALDAMEKNDLGIEIFDPVGLGLYRGEWIEKDINQLRETRAEGYDPSLAVTEPSQFARQYASLLDDVSKTILNSSDANSIETLISRYVSMIVHAAIWHASSSL